MNARDNAWINSNLGRLIPDRYFLEYLCPFEHFDFDSSGGWLPIGEWQPGEDGEAADYVVAASEWLNQHVGVTGPDSNHFYCAEGLVFDDTPLPAVITRPLSAQRAYARCACGHEMVVVMAG